ncbi:AAA family ATPase [[Clostridium] polysaccharolyticum]|uniref:MoxR-like ATPase n=1 Tax=[Clostridium] polysaccharolyticum TaxID=29364 RepID=A0A1I0FM42_9FIRM|nr:MoxR family ATPase [[Clostridium] polysaccharolyticum]SET59189.1 MoxR-like ATPase [[Clostridium] polysaccharolyticum]
MGKENHEKLVHLLEGLNQILIGKEKQMELVCVSLLAGGHMLLEDVPGVGKTTLAKAVAKLTGCSFGRIQFTPDTLPADILGYSVYNAKTERFVYQKGPVMTQVLLGDELNRTSPKTQAALLEAMEEKQITVDGVTYPLQEPFFVIAAQNPVGFLGTYQLPEAQLDRFFCKISLGYPERQSEVLMVKKMVKKLVWEEIPNVLESKDLAVMQKEVEEVRIHEDLIQYILELVEKTRNHENISLGVSPRGTLAAVKASMAMAYLRGREYVIPEDVVTILVPVLAHRIQLSAMAKVKKITEEGIILSIKNETKIPVL